jgi:acetoacetate decarboxylase
MISGYRTLFRPCTLLFSVLLLFVVAAGCSSTMTQAQSEPPYTYHEFDGIVVHYKTQDLAAYRELLPAIFEMPDEPLVRAFVIDYYKMDKATQPYREAAVYFLAKYEGKPAWHCVTMPVTSDEARIGGIYYLGYPKIMGDVTLKRSSSSYTGRLKLNGKTVMAITLDARGHKVTSEEKQWFESLKAVPQLNILNGKIYQPRFGSGSGDRTLLELAEQYPNKFQLKVGTAKLSMDPVAAAEYSERLGRIFSIEPKEIVLAYYFKNKFVLRFQM